MSVKIINCSSATLKNLVSSTRGLTFVASMVDCYVMFGKK
uniref:Uncharacterized protein n=1 Tax=Arabidopsis thaliana TaxID=3702 RepID=Q56ZS3_ARATH|nr:hypothetical protein [Arabidopsis thaliana]